MENPETQSARLQSIKDYGQIHFTQNDRKSWYIRYPFDPPQADESASQNETPEQRTNHTTVEERNRQWNFSVIQQLPTIHTIVPMRSVSHKPAKHLIELLRDKWELPPPELIISVTGGAKVFNLPQRSRIALQKGLVSAAVTTDAWVFTGGTYAGVMKDVGDAFEKWTYKTSSVDRGHVQVPVIGIASWYYATNHRQLIQRRRVKLSSVGSAMPTATFSTVADREKLYLNCVPQEKPASYPLDPNHTHFILLDDKCGPNDETWRRYGFPVRADLTIQLRAEIEQEARCSSHYRHSRERVIIEDGKDIITGSNEKCFRDMIRSEKGFFLINTFLLCPDDPEFKLSDAILQALFRAACMLKHKIPDAHVQKLKLTMAWNKFDLAISDMLIENVKAQWTDIQLDSALIHAIQHGSVQFVELLIERGASFDRLQRLINIKDLYKKKTGLPLPKKEIPVDDNKKQERMNIQFSGTRSWPKRIIYDRLKDFFGGRAIIRYYYNIIFYVLMLCLFSFVMLVDYFPYNNNRGKRSGYSIGIPIPEIILHMCIWGLIIEEAVEFGIHYRQQNKSNSRLYTIISSYFIDDRWNVLDAVAIFIYLVGFITRFIVIEQAFVISKIFMCIDLFLWYVRILHLFFAYERLGPKLLMICNTMKDLLFFIYFIFVFLAAYSISSFALIITPHQVNWIPNNNSASSRTYKIIENRTNISVWNLLRNIIDWGIWKIYGQVDLVDYRQDSESIITHNVYILLNDSSKLDANVTDLIVFNVDNRVINDGIVDKILINFCTAPTDSNAKIKVYIIKSVLSSSEHFFVQEQIESFVTNLRPSVGIQKFEIEPFIVHYGDYVGFKFTENAGGPFSIECTSYYIEHIIDQNIEGEVMHFTPCANHGITVTFTLNHKESRNKYFVRSYLEMSKMNNEEKEITATSTYRNFSISSDDNKPLITDKRRRSSITVSFRQDLTNVTPFQQRDNMLRESTIAQEYWQSLIENIMKEEQDNSNREKKARFKHEHDSVELQKQQKKLIVLLEKTVNKNQHISPTNSLNSSYENYPMS
ncbi:unnamed protein product [Rotaria sp. Silwood2]|nr:unnamed protein product [Rotaria sp. Silwood2]